MKPPLPLPRAFRSTGPRSINRAPSTLLVTVTPWLVVMAGSLVPLLPLIASAPLVPPLGFLLLLAWLQQRPHVFPPWAGFPLGLFDDLFSGQPLGSAALLWSFAVLGLDLLEFRLPWRNFIQNWLIAAALIAAYLLFSAIFAGTALSPGAMLAMLPQVLLSILIIPLTGRIAALFDRFRLTPIRDIG
jgi:rod shape-determining protein MreD